MSFGGGKTAQKESRSRQFALGGLSGCGAAVCTHPFDTIKVRMQLSGMGSNSVAAEGMVATASKVMKNEGPLSLYKGLSASLLRQATYTTTRIGLYLQMKDHFSEKGNLSLVMKIALSMAAGAGGAVVGSPADVVLVRMQADGKLPLDQRRNYKNAIDGLSKIARNEGILALWRGCGPNVNRAMLMTAGQLASYDQAKQSLLTLPFFEDNMGTHFVASLIAGFIAAAVTSPLDVVKTRIMNQKKDSGVVYKNTLDCATKILKLEGPGGFYKGFLAYFTRLGPHTIFTFIFFEQFTKLFDYVGFK